MGATIAKFSETFNAMANTVSGWLWPKTDMGEDIEFAADKVWRLQQAAQRMGKSVGKWIPYAVGAFAAFKTFKAGIAFVGVMRRIAVLAQINGLLLSGLAKDALLPLAKKMKTATLASLSFARTGLTAIVSAAKSATLSSISLAKRGFLAAAGAARTATLAMLAYSKTGLLALASGAKAGAIGALGLISKGLKGVALAARVAGAALIANPIGLLIAAIAGAAYLAYKNWDKLVSWWNNSKLKEISMPLITKGLDYAQEKWEQFQNWWDNSSLAEKALGLATAPVQAARVIATDVFDWWSDTEFGKKTLTVFSDMVKSALEWGKKLADWWKNFNPVGKTLKIFGDAANSATQAVKSRASDLWEGSKSTASDLWEGGKNLFGFGTEGERATGGTITAGGIYRVNERGPELLNMAGQTYLMASRSGTVTPLRQLYQQFQPRQWPLAQAANAPVFNQTRHSAASAKSYTLPVLGQNANGQIQATPAGRVDTAITVRVEADEGLRVSNSGVETQQGGSLVRNVGVTMVAV